VFVLSAAEAAGVFGALGKAAVTAGAIDVQGTGGFSSVLVTARDGRPIGSSALFAGVDAGV
jgi:hypothetical protein